MRAAAVDTFLKELKAKSAADLNAVLVTLNEGSLCREAVGFWVLKGWMAVAPHSPLTAITGPAFRRDLTLDEFCGRRGAEREPASGEDASPPTADVSGPGTDDSDAR